VLNIRDVTALPPYRNLILRFKGEEKPRSKNWRRVAQSRRRRSRELDRKNLLVCGSLSIGRWATEIIWCPARKVERGASSDGGNFRAEMRFSAWSEMPYTWLAKGKAGEYMKISAKILDVSEHHMNKVMIASVGPREYQWL
jgi:ribosomal protein S8E